MFFSYPRTGWASHIFCRANQEASLYLWAAVLVPEAFVKTVGWRVGRTQCGPRIRSTKVFSRGLVEVGNLNLTLTER